MPSSYLSPLAFRKLLSPIRQALPAAHFSTTVLRANGEIPKPPLAQKRTQLPYFVHRTNTNNLPVYPEAKRGGSLRQTRIRKVEGDANALREDLIEYLNLEPEWVTINGLTNHIIIKGWKKDNVEKLLKELNF